MFGTKQISLAAVCLTALCSACGTQPADTVESVEAQFAPRSSRVDILPFFEDASFTPHWIELADIADAEVHTIPAFELTNQLGETITEETFASKIYITDFFFTTCPGICRKMTINMAELQAEFADDDDVVFLSHTVTPDIDTPEVLRTYGEKYGAIPGKWHLARGERSMVYDLGRRHYFVEEDMGVERDDDEFLHTENFLLIDGNRRIRGIYNGLNKTSLSQLVADVRTLKNESNLVAGVTQ